MQAPDVERLKFIPWIEAGLAPSCREEAWGLQTQEAKVKKQWLRNA